MAALQVHQFQALSDNYGFLIHDPESGETTCIDTPEVAPIRAALAETGWTLTQIWNTHWHPDHAGGNAELKEETGCTISGPAGEAERIPTLDRTLVEGDVVTLGSHEARVIDVPGHTAGHIAFHLAEDGIACVGDTLFALGCGRLFEGTPAQMWTSLQKLMALPPETTVYCAHEYTQANAAFAVTVDPDNPALHERVQQIDAARAKGEWTVPTTIGLELATNPFLRAEDPALQKAIGLSGADPGAVFAETRKRKDSF